MKSSELPASLPRIALAIAAHPDDIEFSMAGTLLLLRDAGWQCHYFTVANGNCGSVQTDSRATAAIRGREAHKAARLLGATYHPPLTNDLEIIYDVRLLRQVAAVIRRVKPGIVLTHSPQDYMEDHMTTCRLAVTAAFARGMPNFRTAPPRAATTGDLVIYHALPHGLRDGLRRRITPGAYVNTERVHAQKREALAHHRSQKEWLDVSQGMDSYLRSMDEFSLAVGKMSHVFRHSEGWRRHSHLGFSATEMDPLRDVLGRDVHLNPNYEKQLEQGT